MNNNSNNYCTGCFWAELCSSADMENAILNGCNYKDIDTGDVSIEDIFKWCDEIADFKKEWQMYIERDNTLHNN